MAKKDKKTQNATPKRRGPPPMYSDPAVLQARVDEYLATTGDQLVTLPDGSMARDSKGNPVWRRVTPTMAGLAYHLGFCNRASLQDMVDRAREPGATEAERQISSIVSRTKLRIESHWESELTTPGCANGVKLWLTNHAKYRDKQDIAVTGDLPTIVITGPGQGERD